MDEATTGGTPEDAQVQPGTGEPPGTKKVWPWALAFVAIIAVVWFAIVAGADTDGSSEQRELSNETAGEAAFRSDVEVLYEIEGTARGVDITMETPTGVSQASDRAVPLCKASAPSECGLTFTFDRGEFVYISAQNTGESGNVICRITVDGVVISENSSVGAYSIATCDGST